MKKSMPDLERLSIEEFKEKKKNNIIILLDGVRSMHNVGSVFRTADAFLIEKIMLCGVTPKPPHRDIHKSALGATESVSWGYSKSAKDAVLELKKEGYKIIGIEQTHDSVSLVNLKKEPEGKIVLVFGSEVLGVSDDVLTLCDVIVEIPQFGTKHSLNISVSVGIVLWEVIRST